MQLLRPLALGLTGPLGAQAQALLVQQPPVAVPQLLLEIALPLGQLVPAALAQRGARLRGPALASPGDDGGQGGQGGQGQGEGQEVGQVDAGERDAEQHGAGHDCTRYPEGSEPTRGFRCYQTFFMRFRVEPSPAGGYLVMADDGAAPLSRHDTEEDALERATAYTLGAAGAAAEEIELRDGARVLRAGEEGIERFVASLFVENRDMLEVFRRVGEVSVTRTDGTAREIEVELPVDGEPLGRVLKAAAKLD